MNCTGRSASEQQRLQPLGLAEQQRGPLVGGEAAGEADGEAVGVEHVVGPRDVARSRRPCASPQRRRRSRTKATSAAAAVLGGPPQLVVAGVASEPLPAPRVGLGPVGAARGASGASSISGEIQVSACTPLVTEAIGISSTGTSGHRPANISRLTTPWSAATPLRRPGEAQAHDRHVEPARRARRRAVAEGHEVVDGDAARRPPRRRSTSRSAPGGSGRCRRAPACGW